MEGEAGHIQPGAWSKRPPGVPGTVPPPSVPLSFLAAASLGLVACGIAWLWARGATAADPTSDPTVAAVHLGVLATLAMGVLGAMHQFTPVITGRPLRSTALARVTFIVWLATSWMLPLGVASEQLAVTAMSGALASIAVVLLLVNFAPPLSVRGKGAPVVALRFGLLGAVLTCLLGAVFVVDRQASWFVLDARAEVAMGVLGLFGWLGTTYVGVAEKLWPMFMLAHLPGRRHAGQIASLALPLGSFLLAPGIAWRVMVLAWIGLAALVTGLGAHVYSLCRHLRYRRRRADLHLGFLVTSTAWIAVGAGLTLAAVLARGQHASVALAAAALVAFAGWLLETLVGHAHKVVPFIAWSVLRARGVTMTRRGGPLVFADLYVHAWASVAYVLVTAGITSLCLGLAASVPAAIALGGLFFATGGVVLALNLSLITLARLRERPSRAGEARSYQAGRAVAKEQVMAVQGRFHGWATTFSAVALVLSAAATAMGGWAVASRGQPSKVGFASSTTSGSVVPNGTTRSVKVTLGQFYVRPSTITLSYGTRLVLDVTNRGSMDHDLQLEGSRLGTGVLRPGQEKTVDLGVFGHSEQAWCTVPGHKQLGMLMSIVVRRGPQVPGAERISPKLPGSTAVSPRDATISFSAPPPATWHAFDPSLGPVPATKVHHVTLIAEDKKIQVAPGVTQDMWTFGGTVPGPVLEGHVGDVFDVTLVNDTNMDHSLDFHAENEPMANMRDVEPGSSITYHWRASYAGIFLYHCGTAPVLEHLANGMYGVVIIDPPGLAPVAHQFVIVQSELYPGPQGQSGDYTKMMANEPSAYVFNGYVNQYLFSPLRVRAGQRIRIWVLDAGPNDATSFHVVGAPFTTVFKEGAYLLQPDRLHGASQALDLAPAQGGFVEFTVPVAGRYEMVDHHLDHAAMGAAGYIDASR
jgi:nitrite reductase (NO-forming)